MTLESCVCIEGQVIQRPDTQINSEMATGEIEIQIQDVKSINISDVKLPFYIKPFSEAQESLRQNVNFLKNCLNFILLKLQSQNSFGKNSKIILS